MEGGGVEIPNHSLHKDSVLFRRGVDERIFVGGF